MASITHEPQRPRKPWRVDWRERDGRKTTKRFATKTQAQQWIVHLRRGAAASSARMALSEWLTQWIRTHGPQWAHKTINERVRYCELYLGCGSIARMSIGEIGRPDVRHLRADILAKSTPSVANAAIRVLSAALGAAVEDDILSGNPCLRLKPLPVPPSSREPATLDEIEAIRQEMVDPRDRLAVSLLAYLGLRPGELRSLRWRDIRPKAVFVLDAADGRGITKSTKTGATRAVEIIQPLRDDLDLVGAGRPDDRVVPQCLSYDNWTRDRWRPARRRAECQPAPYNLRHSYASLLIAEGRILHEVSRALGHSKPSITSDTYGHLFTEAQISEGQSMEAAAIAARLRAPAAATERQQARETVREALTDTPATIATIAKRTGLEVERVADLLVALRDQHQARVSKDRWVRKDGPDKGGRPKQTDDHLDP